MNFLTIVTIGFLVLEGTNVFALYFFPETRNVNAVGIFNAWEKSKSDPDIHNFVKYLVNWIAGTKLIFIVLLIVILLVADERTLVFSGVALIFSIASFFWRLFPLIRRMDQSGEITPAGYSKTLGWMIGGFILTFSVAVFLAS